MGCGEARLASSLVPDGFDVRSFDLHSLDNPHVRVCDMSNVPMEDEEADVVVFCLSLMGTNLRDYVKEANRILKKG